MKTSRSPLWPIPGYSMFFGFLVIFASGTHGEQSSISPTKEPAISVSSALEGLISSTLSTAPLPPAEFPITKITTKDTGGDVYSKAHSPSKLVVVTSSNKETTSTSTLAPEKPSIAKPLEVDPITKQKETAVLKQTKVADTTADIHTSIKAETTTTVATTQKEIETTKLMRKTPTTIKELLSANTTSSTARSTNLLPRGRKGEKGTSTTPGQPVWDESTPHDTSSRRPETLSANGTSTIKTSEADRGATDSPWKGPGRLTVTPTIDGGDVDPDPTESPSKITGGVTVAIILGVLLFVVLLVAIFFCWRRHHSGSTSFKSTAWAGQAAMLDDPGLDKELEQGAPTPGEGEGRRATLTTFFGKRQSRMPSVAMEEVIQKETGNAEEVQHLMDEDASKVPSLEGPGEANGKLPEPTMQCSQETEFPPPPADQEQIPPTQPE